MKYTAILLFLCLAGANIFAQNANLSHLERDFNRLDATFAERLTILEVVRDSGLTGIGDFYHNALGILLQRLPDVSTNADRHATEASARILAQGLGAERHTAAAPDLWRTVQAFDIALAHNDGLVMHDALTALGQVDGRDFIPHIAQLLTDLNTQAQRVSDAETRRRMQRAVIGAVSALEAFRDLAGFRPVFFVSIGPYDPAIQNMASIALPNIVDDPGDIITVIIRDPSIPPSVKYHAWRELLRSNAPGESRARVAAAALATSWTYATNNPVQQRDLRSMRVSAIDTIRALGVTDDSVYADLERTYRSNFVSATPDYDEIRRTLACLSASGSDLAVDLLLSFLRELHERRRAGPWGNRERQIFGWVISSLGATGTQSQEARFLLGMIERSNDYTGAEQAWARNALQMLGN
ncbi:MAG: hypothetical protein FWC64_02270 [Treponema sp.]|nr:hypothetical protein [Treponema sp.]